MQRVPWNDYTGHLSLFFPEIILLSALDDRFILDVPLTDAGNHSPLCLVGPTSTALLGLKYS